MQPFIFKLTKNYVSLIFWIIPRYAFLSLFKYLIITCKTDRDKFVWNTGFDRLKISRRIDWVNWSRIYRLDLNIFQQIKKVMSPELAREWFTERYPSWNQLIKIFHKNCPCLPVFSFRGTKFSTIRLVHFTLEALKQLNKIWLSGISPYISVLKFLNINAIFLIIS